MIQGKNCSHINQTINSWGCLIITEHIFSAQELSVKCACQPTCLSKHSRPFQILIYITSCLPFPSICIISTFDWWAILETIAASCAGFLTSAFSVLLSFVSSASHYFVWIIAAAFILFWSQNVFSLGQYSYCLFSYHQVVLFSYVLKIVFFFHYGIFYSFEFSY